MVHNGFRYIYTTGDPLESMELLPVAAREFDLATTAVPSTLLLSHAGATV